MKNTVSWIVILILVGVYVAALAAVLHPRVPPEYKAFFIDRTSTDYEPSHYDSTPEQGIIFNHPGLPSWVQTTHGLSVRDDWGRWTDADEGVTAGLNFGRSFNGEVCLDFTAHAVPWVVGQSINVRMDGEKQSFRISGEGPIEYRLQFHDLHGADKLDFLLPVNLPPVLERTHGSADPRRLGMNFSTLRLIPGECRSGDGNSAQ